jgi:hypothetical protein
MPDLSNVDRSRQCEKLQTLADTNVPVWVGVVTEPDGGLRVTVYEFGADRPLGAVSIAPGGSPIVYLLDESFGPLASMFEVGGRIFMNPTGHPLHDMETQEQYLLPKTGERN